MHRLLHRDGSGEEGGPSGQLVCSRSVHASAGKRQGRHWRRRSSKSSPSLWCHQPGEWCRLQLQQSSAWRRKDKSRKTLSNFLFLYIGLSSSKDFAPCMENLHAREPFHYWQRLRSVSSSLNSLSGCVENRRAAFRYWQHPRSVSSLLDNSSDRAENGKVVCLAARTPSRLLGICPRGAVAWVYVLACLPN